MTGKANLAASIRHPLLTRAKREETKFGLLTRFALEGLVSRLSVSRHREQLLFNGALLFDLWFGEPKPPTRDADFLSSGSPDLFATAADFHEICALEAEDGIAFDPTSVKAKEIRKKANYILFSGSPIFAGWADVTRHHSRTRGA